MNHNWQEGITYVYSCLDEPERLDPRRFERMMITISDLVRAGTVLVHCVEGSSRSPVIVAVYMHIVGYKNFDDALSELTSLRPVVAPSKLIIERAKVLFGGIDMKRAALYARVSTARPAFGDSASTTFENLRRSGASKLSVNTATKAFPAQRRSVRAWIP